MSDIVSQFRLALRNALIDESVQAQSSIFFTVIPGEKPKWASQASETNIRIFGLDRAMTRKASGFGGAGSEDVGAWEVVGLPAQTVTGLKEPPPWILFMDWMWETLKSKELNPAPYTGFGDTAVPYNQLRPYAKRQRKYGTQNRPTAPPGDVLPSALRRGTGNWPPGYDIERDVTIIIDSLGDNQDDVTRRFNDILASANVPSWMTLVPDLEDHRWFVSFNYEVGESDHVERQKSVDVYKGENREKWKNVIRKLAGGRTNPIQLAPIIRRWLVTKHGFQRPFHVDILSQEEFNKAIDLIGNTNLDEIVAFCKEAGIAPPTIGAAETPGRERQEILMAKRWVFLISKLADEGGVEPAIVEVALSEYLSKHGFEDPFEYEMSSPAVQAKAINSVSTLTFDDIRGLLESIQNHVRSLMEG